MRYGGFFALALSCAIWTQGSAFAQADGSNDDAPDAEVVRWSGDALSVLVKPLAPDPVQGFLIGRGFASDRARSYASNCVFRVVLRYSGNAPLRYDLRDWRIKPQGGGAMPLIPREAWMAQWQNPPLEAAARMGFEFSQLPTQQTLSAGDTVFGMNAAALPAASQFDLLLNWTVSGASRHAIVKGIRCRAH